MVKSEHWQLPSFASDIGKDVTQTAIRMRVVRLGMVMVVFLDTFLFPVLGSYLLGVGYLDVDSLLNQKPKNIIIVYFL